VWFVWSVLLTWLILFNQTNQSNQPIFTRRGRTGEKSEFFGTLLGKDDAF
jgi:hypothetical protein